MTSSAQMQRLLIGAILGLTISTLPAGQTPVSAQTSSTQIIANAPAIARQGYTLLDRGWVNDAIATFQQALRAYPQSVEAARGLAIAYQRAGRDAEAWQTYQQVLTQAPTDRVALTAIGQLGSYRPEWQQGGIAALTTLLNLAPTDTAARTQRALLYSYQGEFTSAIADYDRLLHDRLLVDSSAPEIIVGAAQAYTYSGDYQHGLELFDRYLADHPAVPDRVLSAYAFALQQTGNPAKAIQLLEPHLSESSDETAIQIRAALATAYAANHQIEQAIATLKPLQNRPEAVLSLARSLSEIGRQGQDDDLYEAAVQLYQRVLQQTQNPSAPLLIEAADVLSDAPDNQVQALQLYQQAIAQQPDNLSLKVKQLVLQQQLGQIARADLQQQLKALLAFGSTPIATADRRSLALALLRIDPPNPEFLPLFQAVLQDGAAVPFLNFRIAQIELKQGNLTAARSAVNLYGATSVGKQDPATEFLQAELDRLEGNLEASAQRYQALIDRGLGDTVTRDATRGLAGIRLAQDHPIAALQELRNLHEPSVTHQVDRLQVDLLRRRGFQPYWERY